MKIEQLATLKEPAVVITAESVQKIEEIVAQSKEEVGWLGTVQHDPESYSFIITDVMLFEQEVHSTTTEISEEGLSSFAESLLQEPDGVEIWNSLKLWGHSHVNMGVTPSGQDDKQMNMFSESDFFIRLITNKKKEYRIDVYDFQRGLAYHDVPFQIMYSEEIEAVRAKIAELLKEQNKLLERSRKTFSAEIKKELKEKVTKKAYTTYPVTNYKTTTQQAMNRAKIVMRQLTLSTESHIAAAENMQQVKETLKNAGFKQYLTDDELQYIYDQCVDVEADDYDGYYEGWGKGMTY